MNWMIDGAYGGHYRKAMGYPDLSAAGDEWEIERAGKQEARPRRRITFGFVTAARRILVSFVGSFSLPAISKAERNMS